jgi:hypothetical protein
MLIISPQELNLEDLRSPWLRVWRTIIWMNEHLFAESRYRIDTNEYIPLCTDRSVVQISSSFTAQTAQETTLWGSQCPWCWTNQRPIVDHSVTRADVQSSFRWSRFCNQCLGSRKRQPRDRHDRYAVNNPTVSFTTAILTLDTKAMNLQLLQSDGGLLILECSLQVHSTNTSKSGIRILLKYIPMCTANTRMSQVYHSTQKYTPTLHLQCNNTPS